MVALQGGGVILNSSLANTQRPLLVGHAHGGGQAHGVAAGGEQRVPVATAGRLATARALAALVVTLGDVSRPRRLQLFFLQVYVVYFAFKFD